MKNNNYCYNGFIDYKPSTDEQKCIHPSHNPPSHIVLKPGQWRTYKCPACNKIFIINVPSIIF